MDGYSNDLEMALVAGARDEAARPRFYETLLKSKVLLAYAGEAPQDVADGVVQRDTKLSLPTVEINGIPHVPFYSSEARMPKGQQYVSMLAVDFLRMTVGSHLALNPGSDYGKAFLPQETASLLDGSLFRPSQAMTAKGGERQLIGQPKDYPQAFADAVARYLALEPAVEQAFLAQHFIAGMHTMPALLVAIDAPETGFERIAGAIGVIAKDTRKAEGAVDVTRVQAGSLGYFANQQPFYRRKKKSFLTKLFG